MPSKLLIAPAEAAHAVERLPAFGLAVDGPVRVDGRAVMARVRRERDRFVGFVTEGVEMIPGGGQAARRTRASSTIARSQVGDAHDGARAARS